MLALLWVNGWKCVFTVWRALLHADITKSMYLCNNAAWTVVWQNKKYLWMSTVYWCCSALSRNSLRNRISQFHLGNRNPSVCQIASFFIKTQKNGLFHKLDWLSINETIGISPAVGRSLVLMEKLWSLVTYGPWRYTELIILEIKEPLEIELDGSC